MKKRINLFRLRGNPSRSEEIIAKVKKGSIVLLLILALSLVGLTIYERQLDSKSRMLKYNQTVATHKIQTLSKDATEVNILLSNKELLDKHLQDDASFLPYYNLLNNLLLSIEGKPVLNDISLNNQHETDFAISFANYEDLSAFLRNAETDIFAQYFEYVTISPFTVEPNSEYQLQIQGKFKRIDEQPI